MWMSHWVEARSRLYLHDPRMVMCQLPLSDLLVVFMGLCRDTMCVNQNNSAFGELGRRRGVLNHISVIELPVTCKLVRAH